MFIDDGARIAKRDDFLDQRPGHGIGLVAADAPAAEDNVIELHLV